MAEAVTATCQECGRRFDLLDEKDAAEWAFGHDCEPTGCEYGCPYGSEEHEARLLEWERTGQW